jgi:hypothetical protein
MLKMMMTDATPGVADPAAEHEAKVENPARCIDESDQGSRRAVAVAVAHLLRIQPGIHHTQDSSSKRPVARIMQQYCIVETMPSARCYGSCRVKTML